MGNAGFWYYPSDESQLVAIDLGEKISDLEERAEVSEVSSESIGGYVATIRYGSRRKVRIVLDRFTDAALNARLFRLVDHLKRGGVCSFSEDIDKAVAGYTTTEPPHGSTAIRFPKNNFDAYNPAAVDVAVGDYVELAGPGPAYVRARYRVNFLLSGPQYGWVVGPADAIYERFFSPVVLARWVGFWPVLRMAPEDRQQAALTFDRRISYTLDLQLTEATDATDAIGELAPTLTLRTELLDPDVPLDRFANIQREI